MAATKSHAKPATLGTVLKAVDELADIKQRLKAVGAAVEDHAGHSKEIDHALERIAAIEKHVGLDKKIAAPSSSSHFARGLGVLIPAVARPLHE